MPRENVSDLLDALMVVVGGLLFMFFSEWIFGAGPSATLVSIIGGVAFSSGVAWFSYALWRLRCHARLAASARALLPNRDELSERLNAGESVDDIAADFHRRHGVPETATVNFALITVRGWLGSQDPETQARARRFVAGQTVQSGTTPAQFLDRISQDSVGLYLDEGVSCHHRPPSLKHHLARDKENAGESGEAGSLLLTTAYLYFLSHAPSAEQESGMPWYVSLPRFLLRLVRSPLRVLGGMVLDLVPGIGETVKLAEGLHLALGRTFRPARVEKFKRQFGHAGSFAIALADIEELALTRVFQPCNDLQLRFHDANCDVRTVWFRSREFAPNDASVRRNWITGQERSPEIWTGEWIERIGRTALGEGCMLEDTPGRLPDTVAGQPRPANFWNRGDFGPLSKTHVEGVWARAPKAIMLILGLTFAIWLAPAAVFFALVASGYDPFDWLMVQGGWGVAIMFAGILAWCVFLGPAIQWAAGITHRFVPKVEEREHPEFWQTGPTSILSSADKVLSRLSADPSGLQDLIDRNRRKYGTPPINTRLAVCETLLEGLASDDGRIGKRACTIVTKLRRAETPPPCEAIASVSMKENIYLAEDIEQIECAALGGHARGGAVLIGLGHLFLFAPNDAGFRLEFDDFAEFTPRTAERLTGVLSSGDAAALPLASLSDVRVALEVDEDAAKGEGPVPVELTFCDGPSRQCRFEVAGHARAHRLMTMVWCAAAARGNVLAWSEVEPRLFRKGDGTRPC